MESDKTIVALIAGVQGGKTACGVMWIAMMVNQFPGQNFMIAAPSFRILEQSTMDKFFSMIPVSMWGSYNKNERQLYLKQGGKIYFRSADDPESLEGVTCKGVWLDEAGQMKKKAFINSLSRVTTTKGQVFITSTPYTINWLFTDIYQKWLNKTKGSENIDVIEFASTDSPYFPKVSAELNKTLLSRAEYERKILGKFRIGQGKVYTDIFDLDGDFYQGVLVSDIPTLKYVVAGIDWGYQDPFALAIVGVTEEGHLIVLDEYYKSKMDDKQIVDICSEMRLRYGVSLFYADPNEPSKIALLNSKGIPCLKANKEISYGTSQVRTFIRTNRFHMTHRCENMQEEFNLYTYDEQESKVKGVETPVPGNDHMMDALRYAVATHAGIANIVKTMETVSDPRSETTAFWDLVHEDIRKAGSKQAEEEYNIWQDALMD